VVGIHWKSRTMIIHASQMHESLKRFSGIWNINSMNCSHFCRTGVIYRWSDFIENCTVQLLNARSQLNGTAFNEMVSCWENAFLHRPIWHGNINVNTSWVMAYSTPSHSIGKSLCLRQDYRSRLTSVLQFPIWQMASNRFHGWQYRVLLISDDSFDEIKTECLSFSWREKAILNGSHRILPGMLLAILDIEKTPSQISTKLICDYTLSSRREITQNTVKAWQWRFLKSIIEVGQVM
jgi:hypothetical protein